MRSKRGIVLLISLLFLLFVCTSAQADEQEWAFSDGTLTIYTDEAFSAVLLPANETVQRLYIEEGVTVWHYNYFIDLSCLEEIRLPSSLKTIESRAGYKIPVPITIPDNVDTIEAFGLPESLDLVTISDENPYFLLKDGFLIQKETGTLVQCDVRNNTTGTLIIPDGVKVIGESALDSIDEFADTKIKEIRLPDTVERICRSGIVQLENLESINLPDSLKYMEDEVLCVCPNLLFVTLPDGICFDMHDDEAYVFFLSAKRLIFNGDFTYFHTPFSSARQLEQIVFLGDKPQGIDFGEVFPAIENGKIYYLKNNKTTWAPNGETEWNGIPIIGIDSLDDLPPVE